MSLTLKNNKRYIEVNLHDDPSIFYGYYDKYEVADTLLKKLSRDLGFSYDLYRVLYGVSKESCDYLVKSMSKQNNVKEILLLVDDEENRVVNYVLDASRAPILNNEFIYRVKSLADSSDEVSLVGQYYSPSDTISSVIIKRTEPFIVEEKFIDKDPVPHSYDIGVLLVNDEASSSYTRLVVYIGGQPLYLPASYYNATTSRFKRSTNSSVESLEVLVLKIIDDLRSEELLDRMKEFHYRYRDNKEILATYEEYNNLLRAMRRIPTVIEDNSVLEDLIHRHENFERHYFRLEDKKSSYIWRCTAISDVTIGALVSITSNILDELAAPDIEYSEVRELLGSYISTNRIIEEIAREDIDQ